MARLPRPLVWSILLVAIVLAVFGRTIAYEFVEYDDDVNVYRNVAFQPVTVESVLDFWRRPYQGLYIPLTYSVFAAEAAISTPTPVDAADRAMRATVFHAGNVLLYAIATLLVFALLRRLVGHDPAAALGAVVFAVHPLQVETVAWITEMRGLLSAAFGLLAILLYLDPSMPAEAADVRSDARVPRARRGWRYGAATLCFALALLSKPTAACVPLLAAVFDTVWMRRPWRGVTTRLLPWALMALAVAVVTKGQQPAAALPPTSIIQRFCVAGDALAFYAAKVIAPVHLALIYDRPLDAVLRSAALCWPWLGIAAAVALIAASRRRRIGLTAALVFAAALAPQVGLVPFEYQRLSIVADRYAYLALLGPSLAVAALAAAAPARFVLAVFVAATIVLGGASSVHAAHWKNDDALFTFALAANPRSPEAMNGLGILAHRRGNLDAAERYYRAALAIRPEHATVHRNLGLVMTARGDWNGAIAEFRQAVATRPNFAEAYRSLGHAYEQIGQPYLALEAYRHALAALPGYRAVYSDAGVLLFRLGDAAGAEANYRAAVSKHPDWAGAHANLAVALAEQDRLNEAADEARRALALDPAHAGARDTLDKIERLLRGN